MELDGVVDETGDRNMDQGQLFIGVALGKGDPIADRQGLGEPLGQEQLGLLKQLVVGEHPRLGKEQPLLTALQENLLVVTGDLALVQQETGELFPAAGEERERLTLDKDDRLAAAEDRSVGYIARSLIREGLAAYSGVVVATTDATGYFQSDFTFIPGDEMVSIEAELAGYAFDPPYYYWRHYHGYEITTCDFAATSVP